MSRAYLVTEKGAAAELVDRDLSEIFGDDESADTTGTVDLEVLATSVNYKDGMALTGRPGIVRRYPLVPGIDVVGRVTASRASAFSIGDVVLLNGDGLGETRHGGLAEHARVRADALLPLPEGLTPEQAAAIGTAGFTSMLAVLALADAGVEPDDGEVLVTGAAGGVGSIAIALLAGRGYSVVASSGRAEAEGDYLRRLGAARVIDRSVLADDEGGPLQKATWAGAVDSVGSRTLATVLAQTRYGGTVVACGLAQGSDLPTTVLPFILRSVTLTGANSVEAPRALRERAWAALAEELDLELLDSLTTTVGFEDVPAVAERILAGEVRGRTVVRVGA
ncbi:oxidoreductase [Herbiconiux sp. CPCC 205716]|uniref:Oxidoreductase n=1 Tax=Herbiconiux gentiana TaxID=2970912 RepID=A0ABT2GK13_9MICO|nr:MDR family oxidoreductase [Herbiconiux gentiana]MCS5715937.1 oxidoreductase [Herbiconiux gentiana]